MKINLIISEPIFTGTEYKKLRRNKQLCKSCYDAIEKPKKESDTMEDGMAQGKYTVEQMQQMGTVAQTVDGLEISGNNFKVNALCGCPDMVLFSCGRIKELEDLLFKASQQIYDQPELEQEIQDALD